MTKTTQQAGGEASAYVFLSGLPATGTTTLGRKLAEELRLPLLDEYDILEGMFQGLGVADGAWRQPLSRASDDVLSAVARQSRGAVLTSFWRHPGDWGKVGTSIDWVSLLSPGRVKIHCTCPVDLVH